MWPSCSVCCLRSQWKWPQINDLTESVQAKQHINWICFRSHENTARDRGADRPRDKPSRHFTYKCCRIMRENSSWRHAAFTTSLICQAYVSFRLFLWNNTHKRLHFLTGWEIWKSHLWQNLTTRCYCLAHQKTLRLSQAVSHFYARMGAGFGESGWGLILWER